MKPVAAPLLVIVPERHREVRQRTAADLPMIARKALVLRERSPRTADFIEHMIDVALEELGLEVPTETAS